MLAAVLSGFGLALLAPWVTRALPRLASWLLALLPVALVAYFAALIPAVQAQGSLQVGYRWVPTLGIELAFLLNGLSLLFALIICGVGAVIVIYAGGYFAGHAHHGRFNSFTLLFMASMLGLVLADDLFSLFVFWELTTIASYLLIGFEHGDAQARQAAWQALLVTSLGGLALLAGLVLLGMTGDVSRISELSANGGLRSHRFYPAALALILVAAFTKSAQFPFHFWLVGAMKAPTPVSAYLHSATMVKAGVYLLARLAPALGGTESWSWSLSTIGIITMLAGAIFALRQTDLKLMLAYATVMALGSMVLLLADGSETAARALVLFILTHTLYKGALFLVVGAVDHQARQRDVTQLRGLAPAMPLTASAAGLAGLSMAGIAPFLGFVSKEETYASALASLSPATLPATVAANVLIVAAAGPSRSTAPPSTSP